MRMSHGTSPVRLIWPLSTWSWTQSAATTEKDCKWIQCCHGRTRVPQWCRRPALSIRVWGGNGRYGDFSTIDVHRYSVSLSFEAAVLIVPPIPANDLVLRARRALWILWFESLPLTTEQIYVAEIRMEEQVPLVRSGSSPSANAIRNYCQYPESGEPEDFILERPHSPAIAAALGGVWPTIHPECRLTSDRPRNEVWMQTSGKLLVGASAASGYCMQLTATGFRRDHAGSSDFGCAMPRQNLASKFWP